MDGVLNEVADGLGREQMQVLERIASLKLTEKQKAFCEEYVKDFNEVRAFWAAGFDGQSKYASGNLSDLMQNPKVLEYVSILKDEISRRVDIRLDDVLAEYKRIAFANPKDYLTWSDKGVTSVVSSDQLTKDQAAAIMEISTTKSKEGVTFKIKFHSKQVALEKLKDFLEKIEERDERKKRNGTTSLPFAKNVRANLADDSFRRALEVIAINIFGNVVVDPDAVNQAERMMKKANKVLQNYKTRRYGLESKGKEADELPDGEVGGVSEIPEEPADRYGINIP